MSNFDARFLLQSSMSPDDPMKKRSFKYKTSKSFGEIPLGLYFIKIINIFNGVPKSELWEIKILMSINKNMGENDLEGGSSHLLILAID